MFLGTDEEENTELQIVAHIVFIKLLVYIFHAIFEIQIIYNHFTQSF